MAQLLVVRLHSRFDFYEHQIYIHKVLVDRCRSRSRGDCFPPDFRRTFIFVGFLGFGFGGIICFASRYRSRCRQQHPGFYFLVASASASQTS